MPAVLPATLALVFSLRHLDEGRRRDLLIAGLMAGLAAGTKYTAGAAFLAVVIAGAPRLRSLGLAALAALAGAVLLNPWFVLDPVRIFDAMRSQGERSAVAKVGGSEMAAPLFYLHSFSWGLGLPAALLAIAGLVLAAREGPRRLATAAVPALVLLVAISLFDRAFARWALPAYPLVAALAGLAVARGAARIAPARPHGRDRGRARVHSRRDRERAPRTACSRKTDTRLEARRYLLGETAPGTRIVIEPTLPSRLTTGCAAPSRSRCWRAASTSSRSPATSTDYRHLGACCVVSAEHLPRADGGARPGARPTRTTSGCARAPTACARSRRFAAAPRCRCTSTGRSTTTRDEYVRPGTAVTVYRLRDCAPSTDAFPPSFRNPFRDSLGDTAVQALSDPLRYPLMETTLERLDGDRIRIRVEVSTHDVDHAFEHAISRPREERRACPASAPARHRRPRCARGSATRRSSPRRSTATSAAGTAGRSTRPASSPSTARRSTTTARPSRASPGSFTAEVAGRAERRRSRRSSCWRRRATTSTCRPGAVDERLDRMRTMAAQLEPVDDGGAEMGMVALIDFASTVNGKKVRDGSATDYLVELGTGRLLDGLETGHRRHAGGRDARGHHGAARRGRQEVRRQGGRLRRSR